MEPKARDGSAGLFSTGGLKLLDSEPGGFAVFIWKSVAVVSWLDRATGPFVRRVSDVTAPLVTASPRKISIVHMVERGAGLPTPEGRAGFIQLMDRYGDAIACVAIVLSGTGFWASAFQGVITGMHMLSPRSFSMRIESRVEVAAEWLALEHSRRTGAVLDAPELASALVEASAKAQQRK